MYMEKKNAEKKTNTIRVSLNEELTRDLEEIKQYFGINADTDMIRFLIRSKKKEIVKETDYKILVNH